MRTQNSAYMRGPNSETKVVLNLKLHPLFEVSIIKVHWSVPVLKRSFSELVTGIDQYPFFVGPL